MENFKEVILFLTFCIGIISCGGPKKIPPAETVDMPTASLEEGRLLFNNYCSSCHPEGRAGLGPSLINKPLPKFAIRFQIRHGVGVMPDFDEDVLKDEQVKDIAGYVVFMRKK